MSAWTPELAKVMGTWVKILDPAEASVARYRLAAFPDLLPGWWEWPDHRLAACGLCQQPVIERDVPGIAGLPLRCCYCAVLEGAGPVPPREVRDMLREWRALRRADPVAFGELIVALFAASGRARVTPSTAARLPKREA